MVKLWGAVLGGYPRSIDVRHEMRDLERGDSIYLDHEILIAISSSSVIGAQVSSGLKYVTDGMLDFHDIFRPFLESWRNVSIAGLLRYFDNNFFYRIPIFTGEPDVEKFVWPQRIRFYKKVAYPSLLKAVIPGPLSLTLMGENHSNLSKEDLANSISSILSMEAEKAEKAGAGMIQIDEPILSDHEISEEDAELAKELISNIAKRVKIPTTLSIYFDIPKKEVYEKIIDTKVNYISLDIMDSPSRGLELIKSKGFSDKKPILGLIDSRRIYDDNCDKIKEIISNVLNLEKEEIGITTTTWFDVIPYNFAIRKTYLLGYCLEKLGNELNAEIINPIKEVEK
ncbi:methionine synthase II (cobalamin-independent) [Caldisphaera lagunensis DSM 15908]|uniref:Methionine synthase II (Cobalamin-independent) n=1 Tax=Caldisphaera lagunensis (strain DSM 15908 / JCM 11604 / ANMR 0165 / IC-154) TaxID=1056495 RepID=L0ACV1_CALLD|nr:methionine synthase II (cobalamin-independent) [Caldisphaera lagunensis]AFZ70972.1 methionine synthase II (cobalamin-independent) [Caldisphaera lagunensis DSM 15908]